MSKGGQSGYYRTPEPVTQASRNGTASGGSLAVLNGCGAYSVDMRFQQYGPYWDGYEGHERVTIDQNRTYINVPC
ncbi:hypothetical protein AB8O64_04945 [Streptomyces sp. QH1-20]|uniref:hypothetical protein n=1 Tax=Streptomyces sp. QH1-20 TaxID=3240934 RepID=UPI0035127771